MFPRVLLFAAAFLACAATGVSQQAQPPVVTVLDSNWVALRFDPQYPHGRHTQNPLPGNSLKLPIPESLMIKGQAGQSSDNKQDTAEFRIPVPDFAADAGSMAPRCWPTCEVRTTAW